MHDRDLLLQQRARCIKKMFDERTVNDTEPLSRERIRDVIQGIVMELEEERRCEAHG